LQGHKQNFNKKEGLIPHSLLHNKLSEAGANTPQLAAESLLSVSIKYGVSQEME